MNATAASARGYVVDLFPPPFNTHRQYPQGAYVWIYPSKEQVAIEGEENMTNYSFANKIGRKGFCKKCGVHIVNDVNMPPDGKEIEPWRERFMKTRPITLRLLNDFDYRTLQDRTRKEDGWKDLEPPYVNP